MRGSREEATDRPTKQYAQERKAHTTNRVKRTRDPLPSEPHTDQQYYIFSVNTHKMQGPSQVDPGWPNQP